MKQLKNEASVKRAVEDLCKYEHIPCYRMQAGNLVIPSRGRIRLNAPGTPDLLLTPRLPMGIANIPTPVLLWVELKRPDGGKVTDEQRQFAEDAKKRNEYHLFVTDVGQVVNWLKENHAR